MRACEVPTGSDLYTADQNKREPVAEDWRNRHRLDSEDVDGVFLTWPVRRVKRRFSAAPNRV